MLIISHCFPPSGGGGVQRTAKFVKYLPLFGWEPLVLTVGGKSFSIIDEDLAKELPQDLKVFRTKSLIAKKKADIFRQKTLLNQGRTSSYGKRSVQGRMNKLFWGIRDFVFIPDVQVGWIPFALASAEKILRNERVDAIYTTGGPFSTFLVGYVLKKIIGKPWLVDFRDGWTQSSYRVWENQFRKRLEGFLEHSVLRNADRVITVTRPMRDYFMKVYPEIPRYKFEVIPNGFDPQDFEDLTPRRFSKFTICYTGQIRIDMYSPEFLFRALSILLDEVREIQKDMQVIFVGTFADNCRPLISKYGLEEIVQTKGYLSHREAIRYQKSADLLLLLFNANGGGEEILTGKLLEYMNHSLPILALIPHRSEAAKLIDQTKTGIVIDPHDVAKIKQAVYDCYKQYKRGDLSVKRTEESILQKFDRVELTGKLAEQLNSVL